MSCCGEPRVPPAPTNEKAAMSTLNGSAAHSPMSQQPPPHPGLTPFNPPPMQAPAMSHQQFPSNASSPPPNPVQQWNQNPQQQDYMGAQYQPSQSMQQQYTGTNGSTMGSFTPLVDPNIIRPNPVHAASSIRSSTLISSPPPMSPPPTMNGGMNGQYGGSAYTTPSAATPAVDEGKMSVSIDFGTTFSGVAYGSSRIAGGNVQQILSWPGASENFRKIPTCLLYDEDGQVLAWGLEAKNSSPMPGTIRCEW